MTRGREESEPATPTLREGPLRRESEERERVAPEPDAGEGGSSGVIVASRSGPRQYEVVGLIGRGGMGDVHVARDARVGRSVALKVLRDADGAEERLAPRFFREARVQGQLEHPSVVPVYDLDLDADGRAFFVMKKVAGETLDAIVRGLRKGDAATMQRYSLRRLLTAFQQICLTIDYAHTRGVIHRDIKLSNLMLGDFGEVYVLDWGVAKVQDLEEPQFDPVTGDPRDTAETRHDDVLGTVGYMAPEQIIDSRNVDARADVYSLGAVLFALLTRQPLHGRGSPIQLAESTRRGADARASMRAPQLEIPPELDAICVRATALRPEDRFPTARALHDAVGRFLDGERDTALRAQLSASHLAEARAELAKVEGADEAGPEARRRALRQAGRALALDPGSGEATELLARLMFTPPTHLPPEVESETVELSHLERVRTARAGIWAVLGFAGALGLILWLGVHSWQSFALVAIPLALATVGLVLVSSERYRTDLNGLIATILGFLICLAIGGSSRILGALWLPPLFAGAYASVIAATHGLGRWRIPGVVLALLSVVVPWGLEAFGIVPSQFSFAGDRLQIAPDVVFLHGWRGLNALGIASVGTILLVAGIMWSFSSGDMRNRRDLQLLLWHFRQIASHGEDEPIHSPAESGAPVTLPPDDDLDPDTKLSRRTPSHGG